MFRRTGQNRIVAIACVALCLVVKVSGAADAKRENDGDEWSSLRKAVLARFDINHNGRLDSKEKAKAYRELTSRDDSDDGLNTLRDNLLARFDKNGNGKLERSEVRTALAKLNLKPQVAGAGQLSASMAPTESFSDRNRAAAAAIANDPTAAVALAAQQLTTTGIDSATAQELAIQRFDLNGDGVLDQSELALAQAMALRELATLASSGSTTTSLPLATMISTGITSTGTTSTGTSTSGMSGGCSGSGSGGGSGSGSSGASGSNGSSSTTNSAALPANNQGFGSPSFANFGARGFGGGRGR
jgi:uncharacterized membrane protein YgcG